VLNILELVGELSYNNFKALDVLRKKRNKVTHEHEHVTDADLCKKCFEQIGYIFMENSWPYFQLNYDVVVRPIC